ATEEGYANLVRLVSRGYLETPAGDPVHVTSAWLSGRTGGIIVLSGGPEGAIAKAIKDDRIDRARQRLLTLKSLFNDRLYIELQRHRGYDKSLEAAQVDLAYEMELPLVATNDVFFSKSADYEAHDALLAIASGSLLSIDDRRRLSPDHYLKSEDEMVQLFADLPEAVENTVEIAMRCSYYPKSRAPILPRFTGESADPEAALAAEAEELARQAREGLEQRIATAGLAGVHTREEYAERLEYEIAVITRMKYPGYFLIVADFIKWAKAHDIPVGPGRGSGAGSLVAYALTITDVDPLRFSLLFERFLNPDRVSMPDFDIDFCQERRDEVIRYVQAKYGRDQVAQIITF
ncbi:MAG: PHP domain-containing protein, partial [Rickettsia endosymbiont of Ixodes persulcatus]|nr:PHP domain-containing protein [Rickettsia endosymbiont of Ixodes persulcatus]